MSRSASPRAREKDAFEVAGRGELQLGVLIETMRREGFELSISRPRVLFRDGPSGGREEPYETVVVDVDDEHAGTVVEKMAQRKGEMTDMRPSGGGKTRLTFSAPSRGLIGYHGEFLSDTRGTGIMNRLFERYGPYKGPIQGRQNGVLISMGNGEAVGYALNTLEERGILFIAPGEKLYEGMVIGENAKPQDLEVNPLKSKQLTNFRASGGKDEAIRLTPPKRMTLEQAIAYIQDDELVEVTPKVVRIRKRYLDPHERKKASRQGRSGLSVLRPRERLPHRWRARRACVTVPRCIVPASRFPALFASPQLRAFPVPPVIVRSNSAVARVERRRGRMGDGKHAQGPQAQSTFVSGSVAGGAAAGSLLLVSDEAAALQSGCTDSDPLSRGGDPGGRGRNCQSRPRTGCSDRDPSDPGGAGRNCTAAARVAATAIPPIHPAAGSVAGAPAATTTAPTRPAGANAATRSAGSIIRAAPTTNATCRPIRNGRSPIPTAASNMTSTNPAAARPK